MEQGISINLHRNGNCVYANKTRPYLKIETVQPPYPPENSTINLDKMSMVKVEIPQLNWNIYDSQDTLVFPRNCWCHSQDSKHKYRIVHCIKYTKHTQVLCQPSTDIFSACWKRKWQPLHKSLITIYCWQFAPCRGQFMSFASTGRKQNQDLFEVLGVSC